MKRAEHRILTLDGALVWRDALRRDGCLLATTNGCFDMLHAGHVEALYAARAEADALLVLLNSDASVRALKGTTRPISPQADRAMMLASLRCVDAVVVFEGTDCATEIALLNPDVYVKSDEYRDRQNRAERAALEQCGTVTVWLRRRPGLSTSGILERLQRGMLPRMGDGGGAAPRPPAGELVPPRPPEQVAPADTEGVGMASASASPARPSGLTPAAGNGGADAAGSAGPASVPAVARMDEGSGVLRTAGLPAAPESGCGGMPLQARSNQSGSPPEASA